MSYDNLYDLNTVSDMRAYLRISRSKFYEIVSAGLPATLYIGSSPRWSKEDISAWIQLQIAKKA